MFENKRFEIVITSDDSLVNYNIPENQLLPFGNLYSADSFNINNKSGKRGSNSRPSVWETDALPAELFPLNFYQTYTF